MIYTGNLYQHADGDVYRVKRIYNTPDDGVRVEAEVIKESETRKPAPLGSRWTWFLTDLEEMIADGDFWSL